MATRLDMKVRVNAPVDELFELMADPETEESWNPDALEVRRIDRGPIGPGAQWQGRYKRIGTMHIKLDEYEHPNRLVFSITVAGWTCIGRSGWPRMGRQPNSGQLPSYGRREQCG